LSLNFYDHEHLPPVYVGSSIDISDRLRDYTNVFKGKLGQAPEGVCLALKKFPQEHWNFVWAACYDYELVEKELIKTLSKSNQIFLFNKQYTGSYSTPNRSLERWEKFYLDNEVFKWVL